MKNPGKKFEPIVQDLLNSKFKLCLEKIPEIDGIKTPDFRMIVGGKVVLVAELKTLLDAPLEDDIWKILDSYDDITTYDRSENAVNKIDAIIKDAAEQANGLEGGKLLILYSMASVDVYDLQNAVIGYFEAEMNGRLVKISADDKAFKNNSKYVSQFDILVFINPPTSEIDLISGDLREFDYQFSWWPRSDTGWKIYDGFIKQL